MIDLAGPPGLILKDTVPGHLSASLHLSVGGYDASTRNITEMAISFSSQGHPIQFVADETVICNGVALQRGGGIFDMKLATETFAGKIITCTYRSGPSSATIVFTAPVGPAILSPQENANLARGPRTPVTFRVGGHSTMFYVIALGPNTKAWSDPVGTQPPQSFLDTSGFSPVLGSSPSISSSICRTCVALASNPSSRRARRSSRSASPGYSRCRPRDRHERSRLAGGRLEGQTLLWMRRRTAAGLETRAAPTYS